MKKILHLVCNSHLDPVWQWDWDEGASAALSTFYAACNLLDKYDFIFCHNEVLLYEYIEKYDPTLFMRIQKLVEEGKWKIMGGWYIQPDCLVPSGESFIRQCSLGREYFQDKFNVKPTTAINFDAFGHTRGIADVLANCGYDSYCFCRPMEWIETIMDKDLPHGPFLWKGYSGKTVKAIRVEDLNIYCSAYGQAKEAIIRKESHYDTLDTMPILWGVGNHGGLSSEKDLEDIMVLQDEKKGEWEIKHSTLEDYFASVNPTIVDNRQFVCFIKSYSSVNAIKLGHDQLENALYMTERVCSAAELQGGYKYSKDVLKDAEKVLCQIEFHDVLSGTAIKTGTMSSLRKIYGTIDALKKELFGAFNHMASKLKKVIPDDENFVVLNPYPYEYNGYVETELFMRDPVDPKVNKWEPHMYDEFGNSVDCQVIKEESYINMDRRKRIIYKVSIPALSAKSYGLHVVKKDATPIDYSLDGNLVYKDNRKTVVINKDTGLIDSFIVDGKEMTSKGVFEPVMFDDNEDPWGWRTKSLLTNLKSFKLDKSGKGIYQKLAGFTVVEKGDLLTQVEVTLSKGESHVVMNYKLYKDSSFVDINLHVLWNEAMKGLKIKIPGIDSGKYFAQMAFGREIYKSNGYEYPCNRYVGLLDKDNKDVLTIYNNSGIHSCAKKGKNLYLTLLNGSAYCAHPTDGRNIIPDERRYVEFIEQGSHDFSFRMGLNNIDECERLSLEFNQPVYSQYYFPHGDGNSINNIVTLSNKDVVISALKRRNNGTYLIRLYNGCNHSSETSLTMKNVSTNVVFKQFEFKTFVFDGSSIKVNKDSSIY